MRFSQCISLVAGAALLLGCADEGPVQPGNAKPVAEFTSSCTQLRCSFTDQSTDPDAGGSVASRAWNFGDGQTSSDQNPTHTYAYPGGRFSVTLTVTDDDGAGATAMKQIDVSPPDRSGIYERDTPHGVAGRHSRYVLRADGTFELRDWTGADTTIYTGRWESAYAGRPGHVIRFDFDGFEENTACGAEGFGAYLLDGYMGIAYCGVMIQAGLEEGVYTTTPGPGTPGSPPPQAGQIAFVRDGRIYRVNTDGSGLVQLSAGGDPAWSSDGTRIAFWAWPTAGIHIMDADGSNVVRRTTGGGSPTWSPDGEWIAFDCWDAGLDGGRLCKVRAADDGTTAVTIAQELGYVEDPAWSPDGTRIAFITDWAGYDFFFDIWVMAPDGSQRTILRPHTSVLLFEQWEPAWSPDGSRIALVECPWAWRRCSSSVITVMNADGSGAVRRLAATSGFAGPTWSPDGQVIAFASSSNVIEWVSADGTERGRIIDDGHSPAWRP